MKKYFKTKKEAQKALEERSMRTSMNLGVYKMPKGSRRHGEYAVCTYIEYLNTY